MSTHPLEEIFHPKSIAVVGATGGNSGFWGDFVKPLQRYGFKGKIYPVNPKYPEILGLKAYPSLKDIPGPVDYVISAVPASGVLNMLADCSQKGVKCVHLFTGRFSETGRSAPAELEQEILRQVRKSGIRLIGPNCMGLYYPREGISYVTELPEEPGSVGLASQSGGNSVDIVQLAALRGVRFSKVLSYGNALDLNECDFLDYFSQDPETKIILMYVEGVRDGKRFFNVLRQAASAKPVIILKGGRGQAGARATASHTASLAGSMKIWETAVTQAGAVSAENLDELIDLAVSFYFLPPIKGLRVGVAGGGGGATVMSADQCEAAGLDVIPLPAEMREELKSQGNPIWDWVGNPIDSSIMGDAGSTGTNILQMMAGNRNFDLLIANIGEPRQVGSQAVTVEAHLKQYQLAESNRKPLLAVVTDKTLGIADYENPSCRLTCEMRTKLIDYSIPIYPTIRRAANSARTLVDYYQRRK